MISRFWFGLTVPFSAAKAILTHRGLLFWSIFPSGITLLLYVFALKKAIAWSHHVFQAALTHWGLSANGWLGSALSGVASLVFIVVGVLTFTIVSSVVASPFNDFLAEKAERFSRPPLAATRHRGLGQRIRLIWIDVLKTLAAGMVGVIALVVSWIPVVNVVGFVLTLLLITFQYVSYAQTRREMSLGASAFFLVQNFPACLGFGLVIFLLFAVPFLSILVLPVAVVGGTFLFGGLQPTDAVARSSR